MAKRIAVLVGSLRKDSWNRKVANELIKLSPASLQLEIIDIGQLPLYNQDPDDEGKPPQAWTEFRNKMSQFNGFLFVTPEYNRSVPAALKNAIDVGSRPYGKSIWDGKPGAIVSSSVGAIGGFGANQHLRQSFVFLNIPCMQMPEAYLSNVQQMFAEDTVTMNDKTKEYLKKYLDSFVNWVNKF